MKNGFYFMLKSLFVLEIFLSWLFGYVENRVNEKAKVNFKLMKSQTGQQTVTIHNTHIFPYFKK